MAKNIPAPPYTGGCQCGGLRYQITAEPLTVYACSCTECQRQAGGAFNMSMIIPQSALEMIKGSPKQTERISDAGNRIFGYFCGDCGNRLYHRPERSDAIYVFRPGTLDDTSWLNPVAMVWTKSAQPWVQIPENMKTYEKGPEDFKELLDLWAAT